MVTPKIVNEVFETAPNFFSEYIWHIANGPNKGNNKVGIYQIALLRFTYPFYGVLSYCRSLPGLPWKYRKNWEMGNLEKCTNANIPMK